MKVEAEAMSALESRFAKEDVELFQLLAERTLPEPPPAAAADESAAVARCTLHHPSCLSGCALHTCGGQCRAAIHHPDR